MTRAAQRKNDATALQIGKVYVAKTDISSKLGEGRALAPIAVARSIKESGWYWISAEGVPKKSGYYMDNTDGAFDKSLEKGFIEVTRGVFYSDKCDWAARLYVDPKAAAKASKGEGPIALDVRRAGYGYISRLSVYLSDGAGVGARVTSVPLAQAGIISDITGTMRE